MGQLRVMLTESPLKYEDDVGAREAGLSLARSLADSNPSEAATRNVIRSLLVLGQVLEDKNAKLAAYDEALSLARGLAAGKPDDQLALRDVIDALARVGIARMGQSDFTGAQQANAEAIRSGCSPRTG